MKVVHGPGPWTRSTVHRVVHGPGPQGWSMDLGPCFVYVRPLATMISCDIYNAPISPGITGIDIGGGFNRYQHEAGSFDHLLKERLTLFIENPEAGPKIRIFFYFVQKTLWVNYFQKYCLKVPARLMRNLRKLEIPPDRAQTPNNGGRNFCKIEQFQHASTES